MVCGNSSWYDNPTSVLILKGPIFLSLSFFDDHSVLIFLVNKNTLFSILYTGSFLQ